MDRCQTTETALMGHEVVVATNGWLHCTFPLDWPVFQDPPSVVSDSLPQSGVALE